MNDLTESIETLAQKTRSLIEAYEHSKRKIEVLQSEQEKWKQKYGMLEAEAERLKEENKTLRMASALKGNDDHVSETKRKLSKLMRDIDKCIALLSE
ncbi:MAG: hypothetical protein Kow0075_07250 [Salibacteraceae bacterium]